ncbi:antibiotic biosynthesis monooxygenase [Ensifer sp. HO-A22]|uniref:Antibiotic biosynthesis monooxygenase n=1 Tax=Ensifer oleiphilus TaxID=2742698 RepID=A0A7Y6Q1L1_9HYPH|nr:antibiotic biosynthesis monooxygenase [Ensifer oleiphilus]NVD37392.1 antibiotic biosynthesis monooxygenase [Ensifer oleiphilus]
MSSSTQADIIAPLYRINKFAVPTAARAEFVDLVERTLAVIRSQEGYVKDLFLEQHAGPGRFNFCTMIEFESEAFAPKVAAAIADFDKSLGVDRTALMAKLGVETDSASYKSFEAA